MTQDELTMAINQWKNKIDDYLTSIQAIVGFANFYVWNGRLRKDNEGVLVFQGRRLTPVKSQKLSVVEKHDVKVDAAQADLPSADSSPGPVVDNSVLSSNSQKPVSEEREDVFVTPDLGIVTNESDGVLAEVKILFPKDEERWFTDFSQLMSYDAELSGWPTPTGRVNRHDIVLITEQGRASKVRKFFQKHSGSRITFSRPFVIVQCNRADNREPYYFFQRVVGNLTSAEIDEQLDDGVKVHMKVLVDKYSTVKIYDAEPPLPYMMHLIWTHVVLESVRVDQRFEKLRKRQKLEVILDVEEIVSVLREGFTFRSLAVHASDGTPAMPHTQSVRRALEQMVACGDSEWIDATKSSIRIWFQKFENVLDHFIDACLPRPEVQESSKEEQPLLPFGGDVESK